MKIVINALLVIAFFFAFDTSSFADSVTLKAIISKPMGSGGLPKTGQTNSYGTRDDGALKKGYPLSGPRYTDNHDNTITDNATGLMWINDTSSAGVGGTYSWSGAITACSTLTYAGHSDWRLPNIEELRSLVNYGRVSPTIGENASSTSPWVNTQSAPYWSSSTYSGYLTLAYGIDFSGGATTSGKKLSDVSYIRPVRGG